MAATALDDVTEGRVAALSGEDCPSAVRCIRCDPLREIGHCVPLDQPSDVGKADPATQSES